MGGGEDGTAEPGARAERGGGKLLGISMALEFFRCGSCGEAGKYPEVTDRVKLLPDLASGDPTCLRAGGVGGGDGNGGKPTGRSDGGSGMLGSEAMKGGGGSVPTSGGGKSASGTASSGSDSSCSSDAASALFSLSIFERTAL
jgi:hypothetical protein